MSKLDIDTAIKHCLEVAEQNEQGLYDAIALGGQNPTQEEIANCEQCAADHRQLAEWLMELKDLRAEQNDQYTFIRELMDELEEAKRLLKAAVEDMNSNNICYDINACNVCTEKNCISCDTFHWQYTNEALKLLNDEK